MYGSGYLREGGTENKVSWVLGKGQTFTEGCLIGFFGCTRRAKLSQGRTTLLGEKPYEPAFLKTGVGEI